MHHHTPEIDELADKIFRFAKERIELDPIPLGEAKTEAELQEACGDTSAESTPLSRPLADVSEL